MTVSARRWASHWRPRTEALGVGDSLQAAERSASSNGGGRRGWQRYRLFDESASAWTAPRSAYVYESKAERWVQHWPELTVLPWDGDAQR